MLYIVIETHGGAEYAIIVTDTEGNLVFESLENAEKEPADCQDGMVIAI